MTEGKGRTPDGEVCGTRPAGASVRRGDLERLLEALTGELPVFLALVGADERYLWVNNGYSRG
ncbi:MAG: hypothetical protein AB7D57_14410, partial [Desulfovibrionaceae bacterium]